MGDGDSDVIEDADNDNNHDNDNDSFEDYQRNTEGNRYHDKDDSGIVDFGHAASSADRQAITVVARRYYAAGVADDGAAACSLIYSPLAETVAEDYGGVAGPAYLRGAKTCQALMTLLFEHSRSRVTGVFNVTGVRVEGSRAFALLGSRTTPASEISLRREGRAWRVDTLLGGPLP